MAALLLAEMAASATRPGADGEKALLSSGKSDHHNRFSPEMQATLGPSIAAIEVATYLDKPADYLAKLKRAARDYKYEPTDADKEAIATLRGDRSLAPPKREDLIKGVRSASRTAQHAEWKKYRVEAVRWVRVVRIYEIDREWISALDPRVRKVILIKFTRDVDRASQSLILSIDKEENRRRARNRRELRKDARRKRSQFRWRGAGGRTLYLTPGADGGYDPVTIATAEFAMLTAEQNSAVANHGVYIIGGNFVARRKIDPALMSKEQRDEEAVAALLSGEMRRFKQIRKLNGTSD